MIDKAFDKEKGCEDHMLAGVSVGAGKAAKPQNFRRNLKKFGEFFGFLRSEKLRLRRPAVRQSRE